jgi:serine/threonine protein kinase
MRGGDAAKRPMEYAVGCLVPGTSYVVERLLDQGGQSFVYEVRNGIGKRFVLKVVRPTTLGEEFSWRLEQEAKVLVRLEHPNIVAAHELGITSDEPPRVFIVMELLRGRNLRTVLQRRTRINLATALEIGASIANALAHTHAAGVVHLDVKPANVFVHVTWNGTPVVKLLDFGFMRVLEQGASIVALAGTPTYGAPEQLLSEPISPRTDIYSLGLILYELLSGRRPFPLDDGVMAVVAARLGRAAPPLSRWALVPSDVEQLVMACIERRPDLRPAKAADVARTLWDAHRRALRHRRVGETYDTVESLVGLARDVGTSSSAGSPPLVPTKEEGGESQRTSRLAPGEGLVERLQATDQDLGSFPNATLRRARAFSFAGITLVAATVGGVAVTLGGWAVAHRAKPAVGAVATLTSALASAPTPPALSWASVPPPPPSDAAAADAALPPADQAESPKRPTPSR